MKALLLLFMCFLLCPELYGQAAVPSSPDTGQGLKKGFVYFGLYKLHSNWGLHSDLQFRMDGKVKLAEQTLIRAAIIRYLKPNLYLFAGYAHLNTYSKSVENYFTERRCWQQLSFRHTHSNLTIIYRLRTEQRFVENLQNNTGNQVSTSNYIYGNRVRFYTRAVYPLTQKPEARNVVYLAAQNEVFMNVASPGLNRNFLDQNRLLLAIGLFTDSHTRFEIGYARVLINPDQREIINIHGLSLAVIQTLNFNSPVQ